VLFFNAYGYAFALFTHGILGGVNWMLLFGGLFNHIESHTALPLSKPSILTTLYIPLLFGIYKSPKTAYNMSL
jgi:hypothetical protein